MTRFLAAALAFAQSSNPADEVIAIEFNDSVRDAFGVALRDEIVYLGF